MIYVPTLDEVVIATTEGFIRGLGTDFKEVNDHYTGEQLLKKYNETLREAIELYRKTLKQEQLKLITEDVTAQERIDNLLRSIIIASELIKIDQMIEERYNAREKDNK